MPVKVERAFNSTGFLSSGISIHIITIYAEYILIDLQLKMPPRIPKRLSSPLFFSELIPFHLQVSGRDRSDSSGQLQTVLL